MHFLRNIEALSLLVVTILGFVFYARIRDMSIRYYVIWLLFATIAEFILQLFYDILPEGEMVRITYGILAPINLILFYKIYEFRFPYKAVTKWIFFSLMLLFCLYSLYNLKFHLNDHQSFDRTFLFLSIIILVFTLRYFLELFMQKEVDNLLNEPLFWLSTGVLFYFASNIFSTGFFHILNAKNERFSLAMYNLNYLLGIFYNILGMIAILLSRIKKK